MSTISCLAGLRTLGLKLTEIVGFDPPSGPLWQAPPLHVSPTVQGFPSLQGSVLLLCPQPVAGLQESVVQTLLSSQERGSWAQNPEPTQESTVQALPSSQLIGVPMHTPLRHTSPVVHGIWSSQGSAPVARWMQAPVPQESSVQGLPSSQLIGVPGWQMPLLQVSPTVHGLKSSQGPVLLLCEQPVAGSQVSVVQTLPSSQLRLLWEQVPELVQESRVQALPSLQFSNVPGWQEPLLHVSPTVHWLPSLQGAPFSSPVEVH